MRMDVRTPHAVEHEGDEDGKQIVGEDGEEVDAKGDLDVGTLHEHGPRVEGVLVAAVVGSGNVIDDGVHDQQTQHGAPQSLHPNQQQWRSAGLVHGHDLLFKHELQRLHKGAGHDEGHAQQRFGRINAGVIALAVEDCRGAHQQNGHDVPHDADPLEHVEAITEDVLLHQSDKNDSGAAQQLVNAHIEVSQPHHAQRGRGQVENRGDRQKEVHPDRCSVNFGGRMGGTLGGWMQERVPFCGGITSTAAKPRQLVPLLFLLLPLLTDELVLVARKGNSKIKNNPVHDQPEHHPDKHSKGLKDWFGKRFNFARDAGAVHAHHGLAADAAGRARRNRHQKDDKLVDPAPLGGS
jgi:hypothetical protein